MKTSKILLVMGSISLLLLIAGIVVSSNREETKVEITPLPTYGTYKSSSFLDKLFGGTVSYTAPEATEQPETAKVVSETPSPAVNTPDAASPAPSIKPSETPAATASPEVTASPKTEAISSAAAPEIGIKNESYPPEVLTINHTADLVGNVYCDVGVLTSVRGAILYSSGEEIQVCEYTPNLQTFSLAGSVNASLRFASLKAGSYTYVLTAKAVNEGKESSKTLIHYDFTVKSAETPAPQATAKVSASSVGGAFSSSSNSSSGTAAGNTSASASSNASYSIKKTDDTSNAGITWNYLIDKFQNPYAAAGIMANIYLESTYNPNAGNSDPSNGNSYGICQWGAVRKENLFTYASSNSLEVTDITTQLDYMMYELNSGYSNLVSYLMSVDNAYDAAVHFCNKYEQAASSSGRGAAANDILDKYAKD